MPSLTGLDAPTFAENTANETPQLLDAAVVFTDAEGDFNGGTLTVSGLLAEDTVSVQNQGTGAGQIGLSGANVTYGGVVIGTLAGGVGATLTITFNAAATSAAIDALIQNLTYANSSDTPTASRTLTINVTDAADEDLFTVGFSGVPAALSTSGGYGAIPLIADWDGDGDLDVIAFGGSEQFLRNYGTASSPNLLSVGFGTLTDDYFMDYMQSATAADLDGDGDLDILVADLWGNIALLENTGGIHSPAFSATASPIASPGVSGVITLGDLDGDGDIDAVRSDALGDIYFVENTGNSSTPNFVDHSGPGRLFEGISLTALSRMAIADVDGDGDNDLVYLEYYGSTPYIIENTGSANSPVFASARMLLSVSGPDGSALGLGDFNGDGKVDLVYSLQGFSELSYFLNTSTTAPKITVTVTAQNDVPAATGLPTDVTVTEDVASNLDLSALTLADVDTSGAITVVLTASAGTMTATSGGGVTVTNSGTGAITLTGTASAIDTFLNTASNIQYTGAANAYGDNAATVTITANDGAGAVTLGTVNVDITAVNDPMTLTGVATSAAFNENTVNATPQLLDADVNFTGGDGFNGGSLSVSGLLAEDTVSVASGAMIYLDGATVMYDADGAGGSAAVSIGTASGGSGATFTVTFNANATATAIDALIQSLTYANSSDTPTDSRNLNINITDGGGSAIKGAPTFSALTGAANPANGISTDVSMATLVDIDGDGDLDVFVGDYYGSVRFFENTGSSATPVFAQRTGASNPLADATGVFAPGIAFGDFDDDGDRDAILGGKNGLVRYFENTGGVANPVFTERTGGANPFDGISVGAWSRVETGDLDNDGDLDVLVGQTSGAISYFENTGTSASPVMTAQTGAANPFNGIVQSIHSAPALVDLDEDGDLDLVLGGSNGELAYYQNQGTPAAPLFVLQAVFANPFFGIDVGGFSRLTAGDLDGDGDSDALVGRSNGSLVYLQNTTENGVTVNVTVTAQNDVPAATGLPTDVTVTEDVASNLDLSAISLGDPDGDSLTVVLTASAGTMTASSGGGVTVTDSGTGAITLTGTASAIDTFLNTASAIQYTGAANAYGDNAATVTITANDGAGAGAVTLGTVNVDITAVNDPMTLTGFGPSMTFAENAVNSAPQLLDINVVFSDPDSFDGGTLTLSGLLAEDTVSVRNQGTGAGQIGLSGADVTYGGVVIGTLAGGAGGTLTITFNAAATGTAIDALIQNLTYANSSDTPTTSRTLSLNLVDAHGDTFVDTPTSFTEQTSTANPFNGIDVGNNSIPALVDIDGDGDMDLVAGDDGGNFATFVNGTNGTSGAFTQLTGASNPFNGINIGFGSHPTFFDLDSDGDLDLVAGTSAGDVRAYRNGTNGTSGAFTALTGASNPFSGVGSSGNTAAPTFADLDNDGDLDLFISGETGDLRLYQNNSGVFTQVTGAGNPFDGMDFGRWVKAGFVDMDADGDLDLVVGEEAGQLAFYRNGTDGASGAFTAVTGGSNPLNGIDVGFVSAPEFGDLDGDGDLDLVAGGLNGQLRTWYNTTTVIPSITVTVTAEADGPTAGPDTFTGTAGDDTLVGLGGDDVLSGGDGDDALYGGEGADTLSGGLGDDDYYVDNAGDVVDETGGDGTDTVYSTINYTLTAGVENLVLRAQSGLAVNGTGNSLGNVITGNSAANTLTGLGGGDTLIGASGNDTLLGGDGADVLQGDAGNDVLEGGADNDTLDGGVGHDRLDGGTGGDAMTGGKGNDTYIVDDAGDTTIELADGGTDTVESSVNHELSAQIENLTLTGSAVLAVGNALANTLTGNGQANTMVGGLGNDTMFGMGGNDTLISGPGADRLTGGAGGDVFQFADADVGASLVADRILDLTFADGDVIDLSGIDANSGLDGDQAFSFVRKFSKTAGEAMVTFAAGATTVSFDIDGDGKADYRIVLTGDHRSSTTNLYTGPGDTDGGWVL